MKRRIFIWSVTICMLLAMIPTAVFADDTSVAEVNGVKYTNLQTAIDNAQDGDVVKIIGNIEVDASDVVTYTDGITFFRVAGKSLTIDLNGYKISADADGITPDLQGVVSVNDSGVLTLEDSSGGGGMVELIAGSGEIKALIMNCSEGNDSKITINGGNYYADKLPNGTGLIYSKGDETVIINGGNYHLDNIGTESNGSPWIINTSGKNERNIIITGGSFNADINHQHWIFEADVPKEKALKNNGDGTWTIVDSVAVVKEFEESGSWYLREIGYYTIAEAEAAAQNHASKNIAAYNAGHVYAVEMSNVDEWEKLITKLPVAESNGIEYRSISEAIANISSGDVIKILKSHEIDETIDIDKDVTIDLGDKTLTVAKSVSQAFRITNDADVTITAGTGGISAVEGTAAIVYVEKGMLTVAGGEFDLGNGDSSASEQDKYSHMFDCEDENYNNGSADIVIKAGKYHNFDPGNNNAEGTGTNFLAAGYESKLISAEDSEVWEVVAKTTQDPAIGGDEENISPSEKTVDTGDDSNLAVPIGLMAAAMALMAVIYARRKQV